MNDAELIDILNKRKAEWGKYVDELSAMFRDINRVPEIMALVYVRKQQMVEYRNYVSGVLEDLKKRYNINYAALYNKYKTNSNIMYKSDTAIDRQITADLANDIYTMNVINNYITFMTSTIESINGIAIAVNYRIKIEDMIAGVK